MQDWPCIRFGSNSGIRCTHDVCKPAGVGKQMENDMFSVFGKALDILSGKECVFCSNTGWVQDPDSKAVMRCPEGCKTEQETQMVKR